MPRINVLIFSLPSVEFAALGRRCPYSIAGDLPRPRAQLSAGEPDIILSEFSGDPSMSSKEGVVCPDCRASLERPGTVRCPSCDREVDVPRLRFIQDDSRVYLKYVTIWATVLAALFFATVGSRLLLVLTHRPKSDLVGTYMTLFFLFAIGLFVSAALGGGMPSPEAGRSLRMQSKLWVGVSLLLPILGLMSIAAW